ncbi:MAG: hypothetical protein RL017_153 [Pseudomonadota bacterium]|jgi:cell division septation protein DedD|nr:SPOR domain-containing protein [Burkholderiales bacterium]
MQQNFKEKNTSHLIRLTDAQKKKAKRRLIGSIFLLLVALIILLDVTAKVNPNKNSVKVLDVAIKNTASTVTPKLIASSTASISSSAPLVKTENTNSSVAAASTPAITAKQTNKAMVKVANQPITAKTNQLNLNPIIIREDDANNPKSILNAESGNVKYFVQLIASKDYKKIKQLQDSVARQGILFEVDPVEKNNITIYRLRAGPFSSQGEAMNFKNNIKQLNPDDLNLK